MNQIRSMLDTAPDSIRDRYRHLTPAKLTIALARTRPDAMSIADTEIATTIALRNLARRWRFLTDQIAELDIYLENLVTETAPNLLDVHCVGVETAAALLIAAGDNPDRLGSQSAFAALCGVNPIPASSGKTVRYRLNRAGNRDANAALFRIVLARMSHDQRTRDYVDRRTAEGRTKREIIRILKRYVARELYPVLVRDLDNFAR
jgi:transposase